MVAPWVRTTPPRTTNARTSNEGGFGGGGTASPSEMLAETVAFLEEKEAAGALPPLTVTRTVSVSKGAKKAELVAAAESVGLDPTGLTRAGIVDLLTTHATIEWSK